MILYACVSKHWRDLARSAADGSPHQFEMLGQFATRLGNFEETALAILQKFRSEETDEERVTMTEGQHSFHIKLQKTGINQMFLFFCVTFTDLDRTHAFNLLDDLADSGRLTAQGRVVDDWTKEISKKIETHNGRIKVSTMKGEVEGVKEIMVRAIDETVRRGEALESLTETADALVNNATDFRVEARRVRRQAWWHNTKVKIICALCVVVLLYVILTSACGGLAWPYCVGGGGGGGGGNSRNQTQSYYY